MHHDIRKCAQLTSALINDAIEHDVAVRAVMTVKSVHVNMYGRIEEDVDGALRVIANDDIMIEFTRENIDNVESVDGVITIYLEA